MAALPGITGSALISCRSESRDGVDSWDSDTVRVRISEGIHFIGDRNKRKLALFSSFRNKSIWQRCKKEQKL